MVILVVFNSFNVVKNLKNPDPVARQMPPFYTTIKNLKVEKKLIKNLKVEKKMIIKEKDTLIYLFFV